VWGREYTGGYAVVNPCNTAQDVELPPGQWQRLSGTQVPEVNTGAAVSGTITVPPYDALILKRLE
jgi:hypothetical protein